MNDYSCEIIKDLIPLVVDGVASKDSVEIVIKHTENCEACAKLFSGANFTDTGLNRFFVIFRRKLRILVVLIMFTGIFIGVSCGIEDGGVHILANVVLMPVIGILAYVVFRWKALLFVPVFLFFIFVFMNTLVSLYNSFASYDFKMVIMLSLVFSAIAVIGTVIADLLHFEFGKDGKNEKE